MKTREKVFWILLITAMALGFIVIPLCKLTYNRMIVEPREAQIRKTHQLKTIFYSVGVTSSSYDALNLNKDGLIEKPYFLSDDIQIDKTELQRDINAYNNARDTISKNLPEVDAKTIEKDFREMIKTGEVSETLRKYADAWEAKGKAMHDGYVDQIFEIFIDYCKIHKDNFDVKWTDLTPEQINELDKVYREVKTVYQIEL